MRRTLPYLIIVLTTLPVFAADHPYLLGRGIADVTGPARGAQMWGFVRDGQITEGIHTRLFSRAFIIAERDKPESRIAFVSIDIGSTTHDMQLEVVEQLQKKYAEAYSLHNVILSATHTHSGPGGYWHWGGDSPLGSSFSQAHFDTIVNGIVQSISEAHDELAPGSIQLNQGSVEGAGANRSITAYDANPAEERARYDSTTDKGMTLLKLTNDSGPIGMINWFASHPTAMTFDNCLISGDHKGYASQQFEKSIGNNFVAAFAQTNCGDVTPNLNLNNTGPGQNEFETTRIIGERQLAEAQRLFTAASTPIAGPIKSHQIYIDFTYRPIDAAYTSGAGPQRTCPSAMGYSMGAGSTEDGGGHPMLKEGMTERVPFIDGTVKNLFNPPEPSDECRECHDMKPILFSTGEPDPPLQTQILPITLTQIGQLTFASMPAEVTTMSGRRLRDTLAQTLNTPQENIIIICYANDYGGYITTHEEYTTQQYEGGHTLFGPWTLAAYQQEFDQLAKAMLKGEYPEPTTAAADKRSSAQSTPLLDPATPQPTSPKPIGTIATQPKTKAKPGKQVQASFYAIDPRINFPQSAPFITIQHLDNTKWETIATEHDWSTKIKWLPEENDPSALLLHTTWDIPANTPTGQYKITYTDGPHTATTKTINYKSNK